jgi:predicted membrane protein
MNTKTEKNRHGILFGIILILLGSLLIAGNIGLLRREFRSIIISWQMLLIVIGIISIIKRHAFHFHGLFMLCLGTFFIIPKVAKVFPNAFDGMDVDNFIAVYWPVLLIVSGIILLLYIPPCRMNYHNSACRERLYEKRKCQGAGEKLCNEVNFSKTCIFGNVKYVVTDEFKGGLLQAIFGGIELDLRKAYLSEGETVLNIEAIFGGVELFVPDSWLVEVRMESVLGGIDDGRVTMNVDDSTRKLIIKGSAVFGGVEIRN